MSIPLKLRKLLFNRTTSNGHPAAIPVRERLTTAIPLVDWTAAGSGADVTAVAYPLSLPAADLPRLRVTATFTASSPLASSIFIRAIDGGGKLLGNVAKLQFTPADVGREKVFTLTGAKLRQAAIDAHTVAWTWEASANGRTNWQPFADSEHPVFTIADRLKAPWGRGSLAGDPHTIVPWHDVLERACIWAKGLKQPDAVINAITAAVFGLGGTRIGTDVVQYQNGGLCCDQKLFFVDDFLKIPAGHASAPKALNCQDVNSAIATFSTILGCDVRLIRFQPKPPAITIATNTIQVFGEPAVTNRSFDFHEVAARPGRPVRERPVWDACLMVDFDPNPGNGPHTFELARGVAILPNRRDIGYERRLLTPPSQDCDVAEVEVDGLRYPEREPADGFANPTPDPYYVTRKQAFRRLMTNVPVAGEPSPDLASRFEGWLASVTKHEGFQRRLTIGEPPVTVALTELSAEAAGGPMTAEVFLAANGEQATDALATMAASYSGTLKPSAIGDFALEDPGRTVMFVRGPIVARLTNVNAVADEPSNLNAAVQLDRKLTPVLVPSARPPRSRPTAADRPARRRR